MDLHFFVGGEDACSAEAVRLVDGGWCHGGLVGCGTAGWEAGSYRGASIANTGEVATGESGEHAPVVERLERCAIVNLPIKLHGSWLTVDC